MAAASSSYCFSGCLFNQNGDDADDMFECSECAAWCHVECLKHFTGKRRSPPGLLPGGDAIPVVGPCCLSKQVRCGGDCLGVGNCKATHHWCGQRGHWVPTGKMLIKRGTGNVYAMECVDCRDARAGSIKAYNAKPDVKGALKLHNHAATEADSIARLKLNQDSAHLKFNLSAKEQWDEARGIAAELLAELRGLEQEELIYYSGITSEYDFDFGSLVKPGGQLYDASLDLKNVQHRREEYRSFFAGDVVMNPEHPTGGWSLEQCRSTLELKTMHRVTSCAEVAKIVEFILHCEHFERDGSLGYIATMLSGDGPWPARTTVRGISCGDSPHDLKGVVFIVFSHAIAPLLRAGAACVAPCDRSPPTGFDIEAMAKACVPLGADNKDARAAYRLSAGDDGDKAARLAAAKGTALCELLVPLRETSTRKSRARGDKQLVVQKESFYWNATVEAEPREAACGGSAWALTFSHGRGDGVKTRTHEQLRTLLAPTLQAALAVAKKATNYLLAQGSRKEEDYLGRRYKRFYTLPLQASAPAGISAGKRPAQREEAPRNKRRASSAGAAASSATTVTAVAVAVSPAVGAAVTMVAASDITVGPVS